MDNYKSNTASTGKRPIDISYVNVLLGDAFGTPAMPYPAVDERFLPNNKTSPVYIVQTEEAIDEYDNAPIRFGEKTWGAFWFKMDSKGCKLWDDKGKLFDIKLPELLMPLASLISFSRPKKMTEYNEIIEIHQMGKWSINIQGIIINDKYNPVGYQTVREQMEAIQEYHEVAGAIEVRGPVFSDRRISRIVTKDLRFDPIQGKPGMVQYSIEAVSDVDFLLMYR